MTKHVAKPSILFPSFPATPSQVVGGACCVMPTEAGYQDEDSDEWTTDTDDVETVQLEILRDSSDQWKSYFNKVFHVLEEGNLKEREEWLTSFHTD